MLGNELLSFALGSRPVLCCGGNKTEHKYMLACGLGRLQLAHDYRKSSGPQELGRMRAEHSGLPCIANVLAALEQGRWERQCLSCFLAGSRGPILKTSPYCLAMLSAWCQLLGMMRNMGRA